MAEINNLTARLNLYKTVGDDSEAKISELTAELTDVVLKNEKLMAEIAELKRSYQILCDKYDAMEMCDNKIGADAIQEMIHENALPLGEALREMLHTYADKLRGKQNEPEKKD